MGVLRLFLALSVIAGHTKTSVFGFDGVGHMYAVSCFFIISGFYMAMILNEKYQAPQTINFYANRLLRLYPVYVIGIIFSLLVSYEQILSLFTSLSFASKIYYIFEHIFIVGQDLSILLNLKTANNETADLSMFLLVNLPAWSLAVELMFYLVAPFFLRHLHRVYIFMILGVVYMLSIYYLLSYPIEPSNYFRAIEYDYLSYFFYPSSMIFFAAGAIAYHLHKNKKIFTKHYKVILLLCFLLSFTESIMPFWHLIIASFAIPFLFEYTKNSATDRLLGNLSYPVYIFHFPIMNYLAKDHESFTLTLGSSVAIIAIAISLIVYFAIEKQVNDFRHHSIGAKKIYNSATSAFLKLFVFVYFTIAAVVFSYLFFVNYGVI